ncbi:Uncharacterised protein [Vibrio cholerae]|nr:Uncharacterised protein [Vibrio cholerae]CSI92919.1 Uncharacterised protein [Vibrio cholerae]
MQALVLASLAQLPCILTSSNHHSSNRFFGLGNWRKLYGGIN